MADSLTAATSGSSSKNLFLVCQADGSVELYERRTLTVQDVLDEHPGHILSASEEDEVCLQRTMPLKPTEQYFLHKITGRSSQTISIHNQDLETSGLDDPWSTPGITDVSNGGPSSGRHGKKQLVSPATSTASSSNASISTRSQKIIRHRSFEDEDSERDKQASRLENGAFTRQRSAEGAAIREAIPIDLLIYKSHHKLSTTGRSSYWDASPQASSMRHGPRNYEKAPVDSTEDSDTEFDWQQDVRLDTTSHRRSAKVESGQEAAFGNAHGNVQAARTDDQNSKGHHNRASFKDEAGHANGITASIRIPSQPLASATSDSKASTAIDNGNCFDGVKIAASRTVAGSQAVPPGLPVRHPKATGRESSPTPQVSRAVLEFQALDLDEDDLPPPYTGAGSSSSSTMHPTTPRGSSNHAFGTRAASYSSGFPSQQQQQHHHRGMTTQGSTGTMAASNSFSASRPSTASRLQFGKSSSGSRASHQSANCGSLDSSASEWSSPPEKRSLKFSLWGPVARTASNINSVT